jgi:hypothetical protein
MRRRAPSMPPSRLSRSSKPRRDDDCRLPTHGCWDLWMFIHFTLVKPCNFVYVYTVMKMGNLNHHRARSARLVRGGRV